MPTDYYGILGVTRSATEEEIKKAYRQRARELHPDTNGGDPATEERFKEATLAYETLRDAEKRRRYDMFGPEGLRGSGGGGGGPGGAAGMNDLFGAGLGDLLGAFFSGGQGPFGQSGATSDGRPRSSAGANMEVAVELAFEEAVFGVTREVSIRLPVTCSTCSGNGAAPGTSPAACPACGGLGELRRVRQSILGQMVTASPCSRCRGTGQIVESACPACRGEGRRTEERTWPVEVPAGVDDGSTLRLSGRGASGARGGPPGDLYVHLRVRPHARFRRDGYDLIETLHLPMTQAALGVTLGLPTLDGDEELVVPVGTQSGRTFRLRGRGVPHVQARGRGDLIVEVVVDTPEDLSGEQAELLRQLAGLRGEEVATGEGGIIHKIRSVFH